MRDVGFALRVGIEIAIRGGHGGWGHLASRSDGKWGEKRVSEVKGSGDSVAVGELNYGNFGGKRKMGVRWIDGHEFSL